MSILSFLALGFLAKPKTPDPEPELEPRIVALIQDLNNQVAGLSIERDYWRELANSGIRQHYEAYQRHAMQNVGMAQQNNQGLMSQNYLASCNFQQQGSVLAEWRPCTCVPSRASVLGLQVA